MLTSKEEKEVKMEDENLTKVEKRAGKKKEGATHFFFFIKNRQKSKMVDNPCYQFIKCLNVVDTLLELIQITWIKLP